MNSLTWEDKLYIGAGEPDPGFLLQLDASFQLLPDQQALTRVSSTDLWDIIKAVLLVHEKIEIPSKTEMVKLPDNDVTAAVKAVFEFKWKWLEPKADKEERTILRSKFPALLEQADEKIKQALKFDEPELVKEAEKIWCRILTLSGDMANG